MCELTENILTIKNAFTQEMSQRKFQWTRSFQTFINFESMLLKYEMKVLLA